MQKPTPSEFFEFAGSYDRPHPIGWPVQTEFVGGVEHTRSLAAVLAKTAVGAWLRQNENYRQAEGHFEHSPFFVQLDSDSARAFARVRLLIDVGCALGEYEMGKAQQEQRKSAGKGAPPPSPVTRADRRRAMELCEELSRLMEKGINLTSDYRNRGLYYALKDLREELEGQVSGATPVDTPSRRDKTYAERTLVSELARRFCKSFIAPQPTTILSIVEIVAPGRVDEKTVRTICQDVETRRKLASRTIFPPLYPKLPPRGDGTSGS